MYYLVIKTTQKIAEIAVVLTNGNVLRDRNIKFVDRLKRMRSITVINPEAGTYVLSRAEATVIHVNKTDLILPPDYFSKIIINS
jgi:hypothetical protein